MHRNQPRRTIRISWILSYFLLLAVPIVAFVLVSWTTARTMEKQLAEFSTNLVDITEKEIDGKLEYINRLFNDIMGNPFATMLVDVQEPLGPESRYTIFRLSENLLTYSSYNRFSDFFFIFFPNLDGVLMPRSYTSLDQFQKIYFDGTPWTSAALRQLLTQRHEGDSLLIEYITDRQDHSRPAVLVVKTSPPNPAQSVNVAIAAVLDTSTILKAIDTSLKASHAQIRIANREGRIIVSSLPLEDDTNDQYLPVRLGTVETRLKLGNVEYTGLQRQTELFDWTVQLLVPDSVLRNHLMFVRTLALIGVLSSLGLGVILTTFLLRRNYRPIERILKSLDREDRPPWQQTGDEFSYIEQAVTHAHAEKLQAQNRFEQNKDILREHLVDRLLRGEVNIGFLLEESLSALDIQFPSEAFLVLIFLDQRIDRRFVDDELKRRMSSLVSLHRSSDPSSMVYLASFRNPREPDLIRRLQDLVAECGQRWESQFGAAPLGALSSIVQGFDAIPIALRQARTTLEYRFIMGGIRPLAWDELQLDQEAGHYRFTLESEARLLTMVKAGDREASRTFLDQVFADCLRIDHPQLSPQAFRCLVWDLGGCIVKALSEISLEDQSFSEILESVSSLAQAPNREKVQAGLRELIDTACLWAQRQNTQHVSQLKSIANKAFIEQVYQWLEANFRDSGICLSRIAEIHGLTPSYLSRLFRENRNEGILDVLNRLRIEHAKALLSATKKNLYDVALQSGFVDIQTFIRIFKKTEGTTPGRYRETLR